MAANSSFTSEHYRETTDTYNEAYSETYKEMVKIVLRKIPFDENDFVVDIGGGTGSLTQAIYREARLRNNILCVDSCESMLALAFQKNGVTPLQSTAEEFFDHKENYTFDKALILCSIHHFSNPTAIFNKWAEWLRPGSVCFILTRPPTTTLPFFRKAATLFKKSTADVPAMVDCLRHHGLKVEVSEERMVLNMSKHRWYAMLRMRYMSHLHCLSDQDIEEGIAELERKRFFDKLNITVVDNITAITVIRQ
ncbi:hypothetical protein EMCRGX_G007963 [Ephydatia muelleri]|eukprot:Em0002g559a